MTAVLQPQGSCTSGQTISGGGLGSYGSTANAWFNSAVGFTAEARTQIRYQTAGILSNLWVNIPANLFEEVTTFLLRKNGANGNQTISIPAEASGFFEDTVNTDAVAAGDLINVRLVAGLDIDKSMQVTTYATKFKATTDTVLRAASSQTLTTNGSSITYYLPFAGQHDAVNTTENRAQQYVGYAGTVKNLFVFVVTNARVAASTVRSRKNGANGNLVVSITALTTGIFEDLVNSDAVVGGDLINYTLVNGAGLTSLAVSEVSAEYVTTNKKGFVGFGRPGGGASFTTAGTFFLPIGGAVTLFSVLANIQTKALTAFKAKFLSVFVSSNLVFTDNTVALSVNGIATVLTVAVPVGMTGRFTNVTNQVFCSPSALLAYSITTDAALGGINIRNISFSADYDVRFATPVLKCPVITPV